MAEKESFFWRWVWDAPGVGEIVQTIVIFLPVVIIGLTGVTRDIPDSDGLMLTLVLIEVAWLFGLEWVGGTRLVVPIVPVPWLWVFVGLAGYCLLAVAGVVESM